jgi:WD40 repeat protein
MTRISAAIGIRARLRGALLILALAVLAPHAAPQAPRLVPQIGHTDDVTRAKFSPDGRMIVTSSKDGTALLWDTVTGRSLLRLTGIVGEVRDASFSPDAKTLLTASEDGIRTWSCETGKQLRLMDGDLGFANSAVFSPNGTLIIAAYQGEEAAIWNGSSGEIVQRLLGHEAWIRHAVFSKDGRMAATGSDDKTARIWETSTGKEVRRLVGHQDSVSSVAFSDDGSLLVTSSKDHTIKLWDANSGKLNLTIEGHTDEVSSVRFSPDARWILSSSWDKTARIWDARSGREVKRFDGYGSVLTSVDLSPDQRRVLTSEWDGAARVWDVESGDEVKVLTGNAVPMNQAVFTRDGDRIMAVGNGQVELLDFSLTQRSFYQTGLSSGSVSGGISSNGQLILVKRQVSGMDVVDLYDTNKGERLSSFDIHQGPITQIAMSPNGLRAATASMDDYVKVWDTASGKTVRTLSFPGASALCFSPDCTLLLASGLADGVRIWDIATGQKRVSLENEWGSFSSAAFSPDGQQLLTGSTDGSSALWSAATGKRLKSFTGHVGAVLSGAVSRSGKLAATASADHTVFLWDTTTGRRVRQLIGHSGPVNTVAFSPDESLILTGSSDGSVRAWSAGKGTELFARFSFSDGTYCLITPEGRFDGTGFDNLHWVSEMKVMPLESFFDSAYTPGIGRRVRKGEILPPVEFGVTEAFERRPTVAISSPSPGIIVENSELDIQVSANDKGLGLSEIRAFLNGQRIDEGRDFQRVPAEDSVTRKFRVSLAPGQNTFRVSAVSRKGVESDPAFLSVVFSGPARDPELYVLAIGVNQYADSAMNLRFAKRDAEAFASVLKEKARGAFSAVNLEVLVDSQASRAGVLAALASIKEKAQPQDAFVLFFAGHGVCDPEALGSDDFFLVTSEVGSLSEVQEKAISLGTLRPLLAAGTGIKACKKLLIFDACHSGAAIEKDLLRSFNPQEAAFLRNSRASGWLMLASSLANQVSREFSDLGHGLFTFSLLDGMNGGADANQDGRVSTLELNAWLSSKVESLSRSKGIPAQRPVSSSRGEAFDLVVIPN